MLPDEASQSRAPKHDQSRGGRRELLVLLVVMAVTLGAEWRIARRYGGSLPRRLRGVAPAAPAAVVLGTALVLHRAHRRRRS